MTLTQPATMTFLGTGSVKARPVYGCYCQACFQASQDPFMIRRPASAVIQFADKTVLLDAGLTDLEERFPAGALSKIILTHYHHDHIAGLYSLRWGENLSLPVIGPGETGSMGDLKEHPGILDFSQTTQAFTPFYLDSLEITPIPLNHSRPAFGYLLKNDQSIAYLTDTDGLPNQSLQFLQDNTPDTMVLDCTFSPGNKYKSGSHNDIHDAIEIHERINPKRTLLTHISHDVDCWLLENGSKLPENMTAAEDGMVINF